MLPDFLILGAQKAGTSSLYQYLSQHPDIYMSPVKEPDFFVLEGRELDLRRPDGESALLARKPYDDLESYSTLFEGSEDATAVGEASPAYLYDPVAPERIRHYRPDMRLIAVLRHPVDRAWSAWRMARTQGREPLGFEEALAVEEQRIEDNCGYLWRYMDVGRYAEQVERYLDRFPREQLRFFLFEDLAEDTPEVIRKILAFLEVDERFEPDVSVRHNRGGEPRVEAVERFMSARDSSLKEVVKTLLPAEVRQALRIRIQRFNRRRNSVPPGIRARLVEECRRDILRLEDLIERDLSAWLKR